MSYTSILKKKKKKHKTEAREARPVWHMLQVLTWSCSPDLGRCHPPVHSLSTRGPWLYTACRPPGPSPWPPLRAARGTAPSSGASSTPPTASARGRGTWIDRPRGHPRQSPPLPLSSFLPFSCLFAWVHHPKWKKNDWIFCCMWVVL